MRQIERPQCPNRRTVRRASVLVLVVAVLMGLVPPLPSRPAHADTLVDSGIVIQNAPYDVAVDSSNDRVFVTNRLSDSLSVIDGATHSVVRTVQFPSGAEPRGVAVATHNHKVFVAAFGAKALYAVNPADGTFATITTGVAFGPTGVAYDSTTKKVFLTNETSANLSVFDSDTNTNLDSGLGTGGTPAGLAVNTGVSPAKVFVASKSTNNVRIFNASTHAFIADKLVGTFPVAAAANAMTNRVYVANQNSGDVTVLDGTTNAVVTTISLGSGTTPVGVAVNEKTNRVYVTNFTPNTVTSIDGATNSVIGTPIDLGSGAHPSGVAVNPARNFVYMANNGNQRVSVLGVPFLAESPGAAISVSTDTSNKSEVAVNLKTNLMYVANFSLGTVRAIDTATDTSVGSSIPLGTTPVGVAVNEKTNKVYVATQSTGLRVIDAANGNALTTLEVGGSQSAVAVDSTANLIYVATGSTVRVINGDDHSFVGSPTTVNSSMTALAVDTVNHALYVISNPGAGAVSVYNSSTMAFISAAIVAGNAQGVAVNERTGRYYVTDASLGNLKIFQAATTTPVATVSIGADATGVAFNPKTQRIYVTRPSANTMTVVDDIAKVVVGQPFTGVTGARRLVVNTNFNRVYVSKGSASAIQPFGVSGGPNAPKAARGTSIQVAFSGLFGAAPGDFIALLGVGAPDATGPSPSYVLTNGTQTPGSVGLAQGTVTLPIPAFAQPGTFEIRLVSARTNQALASGSFRVLKPPVATNDTYSVNNGQTLSVAANGLLANDSSTATPATLQAAKIADPAHGALTIQADGSFTYTPQASFAGIDSFPYRVTDADGLTATGTVNVTVNAVPCGPRPSVQVQTVKLGSGQVRTTLTAGQAPLGTLQLGLSGPPPRPVVNARVDVQGGPQNITTTTSVPVSGSQVVLTITRVSAGPVTVPLSISDGCGEWKSFVGFGSGV